MTDTVNLLSNRNEEPRPIREARIGYWTRRQYLDQLEGRIQMTDSGLAWLMRVKRIGQPRVMSVA
jgi:hypothetical protein